MRDPPDFRVIQSTGTSHEAFSPCIARGPHTLDQSGAWIGLLGIRLLLTYEFGVAGLEKLRGDNWFADVQGDFPFPFSLAPADINWLLATAIPSCRT